MAFGVSLLPSRATPTAPRFREALGDVVRRLDVTSAHQPIIRMPGSPGFEFLLPWLNDRPSPMLSFRRFEPKHADFIYALAAATHSFVLANREQGTLRLNTADAPAATYPGPFVDVADRDALLSRILEAAAIWADFRDQVTLESYFDEENGTWRDVFPYPH